MRLTRKLQLLVASLMLCWLSYQPLVAQRTCGAPTLEELTANPADFIRHMAFEARLHDWQASHSQARTSAATFIIPTVVHIVQAGATDLISDACIQSQLDVINEDFQKLNADTSLVPAGFLSALGNSDIEFCLATKDPDGNLTTGINRVISSFAVHNKSTEEDSLKGLIQWPPTQYLNIWVVAEMGNLLGYATFPTQLTSAPQRDGIVLNGIYFGTGSCAQFPYDLGRTATHELGHWLGLFHTFQGGCAGTTAANCGIAGDNICDTPPVTSSTFGCPTTKNTCTETPTDGDDMTMNYMDYVDDLCMYMFTNDQASRMQAVLGTERSVLASQANHSATGCGCSALSPCEPIANFGVDNVTICPGQTVTFSDLSTGPAATWAWTFNGGTPSNSTQAAPSVTYATAGTYPVSLTITNGLGTDSYTANAYINVVQGGIPPVAQGFETTLPVDWQISNADNAGTWTITNAAASTGSQCLWIDNWNYDALGTEDALTTRIVDLTNYGTGELTFDRAYKRASFQIDTLQVWMSADCGESWTLEWEKGGTDLSTVGGVGIATGYVPAGASDFLSDTIDIAAYIGASGFKAKFVNLGHEGNNLYLDNINMTALVGVTDSGIGPGWSLDVRPNPFQADLQVAYTVERKTAINFLLLDLNGKQIYESGTRNRAPGSYKLELPQSVLQEIPAGIYFLRGLSPHGNVTRKLMKLN